MRDTQPVFAEPLYIQLKTPDEETILTPPWPRLSCRVENEALLEGTKLRFGNRRHPPGNHDWEISSVADEHRLAFNRVGGVSLDLSVKGPMRFLTGNPPSERLCILANGDVGIGTTAPDAKLDVRGEIRAGNSDLYFTNPNHIHTGIGNTEGFAAIENAKDYKALMILGRAEGMPQVRTVKLWDYLQVNGPLDVTRNLTVSENAVVNNVFVGDVGHGGGWAGFSHKNRVGPLSYGLLQSQDGLYTLINKKSGGGHIGFRVDNNDKVTITDNGSLTVHGDFWFPSEPVSSGAPIFTTPVLTPPAPPSGLARLSASRYNNESSPPDSNVKLIMADIGFNPVGTYEFAIGHTNDIRAFPSGSITNFKKVFSVNQNGEAYFAAGKVGYVVDHFVNRVGEALEQGDVVVISRYESLIYSGTDNNIPLPEVDLATKAYDTRVCGIVANAVTEQNLPFVEPSPEGHPPPEAQVLPKGAVVDGEEDLPYEHPLKIFAAPVGAAQDRRSVKDQQMGKMVTLGAYAHCKVDADIAPIEVGDLLTTSPTKGHAQKALDPAKAVGAMIGKALGSLKKGKGKIPVLVMLQ
jgi:hypothetical protein